MEFDWKHSPLYLKYREVCWSDDFTQIASIIEEGVSSSNPVERAYWLSIKANRYAEHWEIPGNLDRAWDTLELALQTAPDPGLQNFRASMLQMALANYGQEGPVHRLQAFLQQLRPELTQLVGAPAASYNVAAVSHYAGRFRQARLWFRRALGANYLDTQQVRGRVRTLALGAWVSLECSRVEEGEAYLQEARRLYKLHAAGEPRHFTLVMAETWSALERGHLQEARSLLQEHMVSSHHRTHPMTIFHSHFVAARLALAEGSPDSYRYYCDLARAVGQAQNLTLSLQYLKRVMADTERKYGAPAAHG